MSSCRTCGASIRWVESEAGKAMPIDAAPVAGGNLVLRGNVAVVVSPLLESAEERDRPHYVSHFATCPQASQHRRGRR